MRIVKIKSPKARINHTCDECEEVIKVNQIYQLTFYAKGNGILYHKNHANCLNRIQRTVTTIQQFKHQLNLNTTIK